MKKIISIILILLLVFSLSSCGNSSQDQIPSETQLPVPSVSADEDTTQKEDASSKTEVIHIASLKGPTSMGLVDLYNKADQNALSYELIYELDGAADEITPKLISGELDAAAIPANLAAVLYSKTEGNLVVAAINTLGVLYIIEQGDTVHSVADLKGKTIYTTGKGTTPEFALDYVLKMNGIDPENDVTIEFSSEATEVSSMLEKDVTGNAVAMLPQPYVTAVTVQNENMRVALSMSEEWDKVSENSKLVTGVLVFRKDFSDANPDLVESFLNDYSASIDYSKNDLDGAASLIEQYGIVAKAPIAKKALPFCNITFIRGTEMKTALVGYLQTLFDKNPASVGGKLPDDVFYYGA